MNMATPPSHTGTAAREASSAAGRAKAALERDQLLLWEGWGLLVRS